MSDFYDGTKLLSMKDIDNEVPEIFMCTSNRSAGKTTYFNRLCVNGFKKRGEKFCLVYRFNYELDNCADKFFKEIGRLFFPTDIMTSKRMAKGKYHELFLNDVSCGYAVALNDADSIKKISHFFVDVQKMLMDEFQSETSHYCPDEVNKFRSVHVSMARGNGKQVRYLPVYMISNPVTLLNPYYCAMGISSRLNQDTRFLRGTGFVLEQGYNESASVAQKESAFNRAFQDDKFSQYIGEAIYLNDNQSFIERPKGVGRYLCTIKYMSEEYAIREYPLEGIVYCDDRVDASFRNKLSVTTDDHNINYVMLKNNEMFLTTMRYLFEKGCFRFKDLKCKDAILKALSY
ncbi:MAG: phage DNA encapsidation protein [Methanobrevibacter sp.]|nr:phage DNA encapsidation protein [Methanobrevibacter sp.]